VKTPPLFCNQPDNANRTERSKQGQYQEQQGDIGTYVQKYLKAEVQKLETQAEFNEKY
jgi:hypothetical protein